MDSDINDKKIEETYKEMLSIIQKIENKDLKLVAIKIFEENKEKIINRPAMPDYLKNDEYICGSNHFFRGGLLSHLLNVTKISLNIASLYKGIDTDLVVFGACLHDIGKIITIDKWNEKEELKSPSNIEGDFLEHTYYGVSIVKEYLDKNANIDNIIKQQALHIIASHMSKDIGAFTENCMIESVIVSEADDLDSKIEPILSNFSNLPNKEIRYYDNNLKRNIYRSTKLNYEEENNNSM